MRCEFFIRILPWSTFHFTYRRMLSHRRFVVFFFILHLSYVSSFPHVRWLFLSFQNGNNNTQKNSALNNWNIHSFLHARSHIMLFTISGECLQFPIAFWQSVLNIQHLHAYILIPFHFVAHYNYSKQNFRRGKYFLSLILLQAHACFQYYG